MHEQRLVITCPPTQLLPYSMVHSSCTCIPLAGGCAVCLHSQHVGLYSTLHHPPPARYAAAFSNAHLLATSSYAGRPSVICPLPCSASTNFMPYTQRRCRLNVAHIGRLPVFHACPRGCHGPYEVLGSQNSISLKQLPAHRGVASSRDRANAESFCSAGYWSRLKLAPESLLASSLQVPAGPCLGPDRHAARPPRGLGRETPARALAAGGEARSKGGALTGTQQRRPLGSSAYFPVTFRGRPGPIGTLATALLSGPPSGNAWLADCHQGRGCNALAVAPCRRWDRL